MPRIEFKGTTYRAERDNGQIHVYAQFRFNGYEATKPDLQSARLWLSDHGLKKSKAIKLLDELEPRCCQHCHGADGIHYRECSPSPLLLKT